MANRHLIGKQTFDLRLSAKDDAHEIQHELSRLYWQRVVPTMERLFDRLAGPEDLIQLNKLELDLGMISPQDLGSDVFVQKLLSELEAALLEGLAQNPPNIIRKPLRLGYFDLWLYFLEHGTLPAYASIPESTPAWHRHIFDTLALDMKAVERLRQLLAASPQALERIIFQHEGVFLQQITGLFTGYDQHQLPEAILEIAGIRAETLHSTKPAAKVLRESESEVWRIVLRVVIFQRLKVDFSTLMAFVIQDSTMAPWLPLMVQSLKKRSKKLPLLAQWLPERKANSTASDHPAEIPISYPLPKTPPDPIETDKYGYFIQNAGIVLLHPFLLQFFKRLDLCEGVEFKDDWSRQKAIGLLHYLGMGETHSPEYQLVLPKVLCGLPLNLPLDCSIQISPAEQAEADNLLSAVIEHWGALGSTSPGGLREGFLQREGKLEKRQSGWLLHIESKTLDILLDCLPWNLSLLKLPWMEEMLKVEWR